MKCEELGSLYKKIFKRKYLLYLGLGFGLLSLCPVLAPRRYEDLQRLKLKVRESKLELEKISKFKLLHPDFSEYKLALEKEAQEARKILPKNYDEQNFLAGLDKRVGALEVVNVVFPASKDVTSLKDEKNIKLYPTRVHVKGDYFALLKFIKSLEENHLAVQNLKLKADKFGTLEASMSIVSFISP